MTTRSTFMGCFPMRIGWWRGVLLALGLVLVWQALRGMPWAAAWGSLAGIGPYGLMVLLVLNVALLPLMTVRWWLLLRTIGSPVGLDVVCAYRFAASAVSYLTPGPHFGGEPLLVYLLCQRQQMPLSTAVTSIALDRMLELLASIVVLSCSLILLAASGSSFLPGEWAVFLAVATLALLGALLAALLTGRRPLSRLCSRMARFHRMLRHASPETAIPWLEAVIQSETLAETLWRQHRLPFLLVNLYSLGLWLGVFAEFWFMTAFMDHPLSFNQLLVVVLTARLAFFTPLPAGLGVLESALPWVTASLGQGSALGLSLCLLIRVRDLLFSLAGLGLTMKYLTCRIKAGTVAENAG